VYQPEAPPLKDGEVMIMFEGSTWVPRWISLYTLMMNFAVDEESEPQVSSNNTWG
jgi:hypothetical protein